MKSKLITQITCAIGLFTVGVCILIAAEDCNCSIARPQAACRPCVVNCCTMELLPDSIPCQGFSADYNIGCECGNLPGGTSRCVNKLDSNGNVIVVYGITVRLYPGVCNTGCCDFDTANAFNYVGNFQLSDSKLCYGYGSINEQVKTPNLVASLLRNLTRGI